jgi:CheY-like chemotaxis protein
MSKHILVIDDDQEILEVISYMLTDEDVRLETATSGDRLNYLSVSAASIHLFNALFAQLPEKDLVSTISIYQAF